jgi:hypothetical protein
MADEEITFRCTLPATAGAIKFSGDMTGARIQLEIPQIEVYRMVELVAWGQELIEVTMRKVPK